MAKYKIVITDYYYPHINQELEILNQLEDVEVVDCTKLINGGAKSEEDVLTLANDADALIVQFASITAKVINGLQKCRIIARYAIGVDNIDLDAAKAKNVAVANVPDYCIEEVSDSALAHIMNCVRKVSYAHTLLHNNAWDYEKIKPIQRLSGQTVGLIAFGHIAKRLAEKLRPFGLNILAFDPYIKDNQGYEWVELVSLEELLSQADIISIHAPLTDSTKHMISQEKISLMKDGVIIVNTSRGGLIDENALEKGIASGKVGMAGLDVLDCLDIEYAQSPLCQYPDKIIITPHFGWYSEQAIADLQIKAAQNVVNYFKYGQPIYTV